MVLKNAGYCCQECGVKKSTARGKEIKINVHHIDGINWDGIIDLIFERLLNTEQEVLCEKCHKEKHNKNCTTKN
jgi:hypothetical protein